MEIWHIKLLLASLASVITIIICTRWHKANLVNMSTRKLGFFSERGPVFLALLVGGVLFFMSGFEKQNENLSLIYLIAGVVIVLGSNIGTSIVTSKHNHWQ
jgi:branched-subunit amino acid transport protein